MHVGGCIQSPRKQTCDSDTCTTTLVFLHASAHFTDSRSSHLTTVGYQLSGKPAKHPRMPTVRGSTCGIVPHRVVATMVSKLEFECFAAKGLAQQLVPHANAKHGLLSKQLLYALYGIGHC